MTRMTGPDCVVMCNLINTHTHTHTHSFNDLKATERCVMAIVTFVLQVIMCFILLLSVNLGFRFSEHTS